MFTETTVMDTKVTTILNIHIFVLSCRGGVMGIISLPAQDHESEMTAAYVCHKAVRW